MNWERGDASNPNSRKNTPTGGSQYEPRGAHCEPRRAHCEPQQEWGGSQYEPEQKYKAKESTKKREVSGRGGVDPALAAFGYRLEDDAQTVSRLKSRCLLADHGLGLWMPDEGMRVVSPKHEVGQPGKTPGCG